jgi:AcrR family transcriptional regulator
MPKTQTEPRRTEILAAAADLASAEGLDRLSIGALAAHVEMSKSGLFAHFGAKEALQSAVVGHAASAFEPAVLARSAEASPGLPRLQALVENWIRHVEETVYRGGCFFDATSSEFASRPGRIREQLAELCEAWLAQLREQAELAVRLGELDAAVDPDQLVFQLHAYVGEANWSRQLLEDPAAFDRARTAVASTLVSCAPATPPGTKEIPR